MDHRLDFSLHELIEVAPKTKHYRKRVHDALRSYFLSKGLSVTERKQGAPVLHAHKTIKGRIEWSSIFADLKEVDGFSAIVPNEETWERNLVQNSSKSPPGGSDKYHMCLLYWFHLPRHFDWDTQKLNSIGQELCIQIFGIPAAEKVGQMRATKGAIRSSTARPLATGRKEQEIDNDDSRCSIPRRIRPTFACALNPTDAYQRLRKEFHAAKDALLAPREKLTPSIIAIYGPGGYGKSSLAQELCDDQDIRLKFAGGIYWLQFGSIDSINENGRESLFSNAADGMLADQYPKIERPPLAWENRENDILILLDALPDEPLLLIADDLWNERQSSWLSKIRTHVSVLFTTRRESLARRAAHKIPIERLADEASYALLTHGMADFTPDRHDRFRTIAKRFGGWPLLLSLANGVFKQMNGDPSARIEKPFENMSIF